MSSIYVLASGKGGVGKSTLAANLAVLLARAGKSVALIDTDLGLRSQDLLLGVENSIVYDLMDVAEGKCLLSEAMLDVPGIHGLRLLPAAQFVRVRDLNSRKLKRMISLLKRQYDFVLIDCPAGLERGLRNVLNACKSLKTLLVVTPDDLSIRDAERVCGILEQKELPRPRLLVNRLQNDLIYRGEMYTARTIADLMDLELAGEIPEDGIFYTAQLRHRLAVDYDSEGTRALARIADRLQGKSVDFPEYGLNKTSFFRRHFPRHPREVKTAECRS